MHKFKTFTQFTALIAIGCFLIGTCWVMPKEATAKARRGSTRSNVNRNANTNRNKNVNRNVNKNTNVNVNKNVNVNVNGGRGRHHNNHVGGAIVAGVVTGLVVGSIVAAASMPTSCGAIVVNGISYQQCGSTWYQPQYAGTQVNYIVVNPPR